MTKVMMQKNCFEITINYILKYILIQNCYFKKYKYLNVLLIRCTLDQLSAGLVNSFVFFNIVFIS